MNGCHVEVLRLTNMDHFLNQLASGTGCTGIKRYRHIYTNINVAPVDQRRRCGGSTQEN
jgi:hypothetical protein